MLLLRVFVLTMCISALAMCGPVFSSSFDTGTAEGWTLWTSDSLVGGIGPAFPGGGAAGSVDFIQAEDDANGRLYYRAPDSWVGDFLGGRLSFYLRSTNPNNLAASGPNPNEVLLQIEGTGGPTLYYFGGPGPGLDWRYNFISLAPGSNWYVTNFNRPATPGTLATDEEVNATLSTLSRLYISADWVSMFYNHPSSTYGHDITDLDEVNIEAIPEPGTMLLLGGGLLLLGLWRRRASF